jgi:hypothetical protein
MRAVLSLRNPILFNACCLFQPNLPFGMKSRTYRWCRFTCCAVLLPLVAFADSLPSVNAARKPLTNAYHGVAVSDDYQWLEDAVAPPVREWTRQENDRTRTYYSRLSYREILAQQLMKLRSEESARYFGLEEKKGRIFALRFKPPASSRFDPPRFS